MRIASLVPSATELLFALGLAESVVAVTHECDYPPAAWARPHLTRSVIPEGLAAAAIDRAVRERTDAGLPLYELDEPLLDELAPDLIVTQAVCKVCAVSFDDVTAAAGRLTSQPAVLSLDPCTLEDVLADMPRLAAAAGVEGVGLALREDAISRLSAVEKAVQGQPDVKVAALEWLHPVFVGGHWVPQMIERAGGRDVLGRAGERSRTAEWADIERAAPDVVISMPCGYDAARAAQETLEARDRLAPLLARVVAVDASSYFSRPGPRLVDGVELLGHLLHPGCLPEPPDGRAVELQLDGRGA